MAAAQTPARRGVRWAFDVANSPFGGAAEPSTPETSTSSLAYVNSQIVAHGFARTPLDLSDLGREEQNRVVKCVLGMLSQRVDDMTRAEDLSSRLRTLSALGKELASANAAHGRTNVQLAQTTSAIAALRAASVVETRKREQDVARLKERWQRLSSEQAKLGSIGSGMVCANWAVAINEQYAGLRGPGEEAAEGAMRDAIEARERLAAENDEFREVLVKLVGVVAEGLREKEAQDVKVPTPSALFTPPAIEDDAGPALNAYRALRDLIQQLASTGSNTSPEVEAAAREAGRAKAEAHRVELRGWEDKTEKLEREIARLTGELAASNDFAEKSRVLIEQMVNDKRQMEKNAEEHAAGESASVAEQRAELEEERAKFTDAAIRLARERSEFEVERLQLAEEKRQWALRQLEPEMESAGVDGGIGGGVDEGADEGAGTSTVDESANAVASTSGSNGADPGTAVEEKAGGGLAGQLRTALRAAAAVEDKGKTADKGKARKDKKARVVSPGRARTKAKVAPKVGPKAAKVGARVGPKVGPGAVPSTPRSLHPAAQRARARNYAPAVPSPLSRIMSMAVSPEAGLGAEPIEDKADKSPLRGSLADKFAAAAARSKRGADKDSDLDVIYRESKMAKRTLRRRG